MSHQGPEKSMLVKSVEKPSAFAKASYELTLAKVKQLEKKHQERLVSFSRSARNFLVLKKDLNTEYSCQRSTEYKTRTRVFYLVRWI